MLFIRGLSGGYTGGGDFSSITVRILAAFPLCPKRQRLLVFCVFVCVLLLLVQSNLVKQNLAFFGTSCPEGSATAVVCRIADNTLMGQIAGLAMSTDNDQTPINKEIQHFIKVQLHCTYLVVVVYKTTVVVNICCRHRQARYVL